MHESRLVFSLSRSFITRRIKFEFRSYVSLYPKLFFPLVYLNYKGRHLAVDRSTDIVIDGFPRSANSFSVGAFKQAQQYEFSIAHHLHAPAQVIRASTLSVPTILLIRSPVDAILSLKALDMEIFFKQQYSPSMAVGINRYLNWWISFYSILLPYSDSYIVSLFDDTIKDFDSVINRLNLRFKTSFSTVKNKEGSNIEEIHRSRGYHAGPSKQRDEFKLQARKKLKSADCQSSIDTADMLYQKFVDISTEQKKLYI